MQSLTSYKWSGKNSSRAVVLNCIRLSSVDPINWTLSDKYMKIYTAMLKCASYGCVLE